MNTLITWLVPHKFTLITPSDVDYRVMLTFLQFYETLLKFVNFKLYHDQGWYYPPTLGRLRMLCVSFMCHVSCVIFMCYVHVLCLMCHVS